MACPLLWSAIIKQLCGINSSQRRTPILLLTWITQSIAISEPDRHQLRTAYAADVASLSLTGYSSLKLLTIILRLPIVNREIISDSDARVAHFSPAVYTTDMKRDVITSPRDLDFNPRRRNIIHEMCVVGARLPRVQSFMC